jgi:hypothetical protein
MSTTKPAKSPPLMTADSVRNTTSSRKPVPRPRALRPRGVREPGTFTISLLELDCDPTDIAELFTDDLHYRIETRGYFWGYFD